MAAKSYSTKSKAASSPKPGAGRARRRKAIKIASPAVGEPLSDDEQAQQLAARFTKFPDRATLAMLDAEGLQHYSAQFAKLRDDLSGAQLSNAQRQQMKNYQYALEADREAPIEKLQTKLEVDRAKAEQADDAEGLRHIDRCLVDLKAARAENEQDHLGRSATPKTYWSLDRVIPQGCRFDPEAGVEGVARHLLQQLRIGAVEAFSNRNKLRASYWSNRVIARGDNGHWGTWPERAPKIGAGDTPGVCIKRKSVLDLFSVPRPSDEAVMACALEIAGSHHHPPLTRAELRDRVERRLPGTTDASWRHIYSQLPPELKRSPGRHAQNLGHEEASSG